MEQEVRQFLNAVRAEFELSYRTTTDSYGYMWVVLEGRRIEDLLAGLTAAGDIVAERGFSDHLLAAVFEFKSERNSSYQYLVYNYKRDNFYPFVPTNKKSRDTEQEMKVMASVSEEMPFEKDFRLWYPLWDLPIRSQV
jgi:hypothetical protein